MGKLPLLPWRLAGLFHPDWPLRLGTAGAVGRREQGPQGLLLEGQVIARLGPLPQGEQVALLARCDLSGGAVEGVRLDRVEACLASGSAWRGVAIGQLVLCELGEAELDGLTVDTAVGCSLRGARLTGGRIEQAVMVDLADARLERVRLGYATTVDLSGAELCDCDLSGADLRGAVLRRARLRGCRLDGATVEGADFAGVRGLSTPERRDLLARGARFRGAGWFLLLRRLLPSADPWRLDRVALGLQLGLAGLGALLCIAALVAVLRPRPVAPVPETPPALPREASAWEVQKTREHLGRLREALLAAHEAMVAAGGQPGDWPSMIDFQQNAYDLDGSGPGEARGEIVRGGLPDNLLTDSVGGVLPYCNEVPTQETIAGVDTDWHYCDQNGRIFACAGYSGLATLEW